ncbi:uncharacterized protein THITE_2129275 [Thermothielavioides terrestris NRRL 8126]|uniref:BTB domain-containing protein n=1 Tax=Thermothielavioides terrestris (strain ATCC 38088 / NRRL 8126) TaxID=578455 RepID=G2R168_THETT|nr:uncharacterized protein THITE_2129275 [Thermothielavioides terrestris NRRL 8126]AEO67358.1 hypothetical protein THITE_2129275 [Thermothielavioides terrestris NRRL 8126]
METGKKNGNNVEMKSPYSSPLVTLRFADGPPLTAHLSLLIRHPKLAAFCNSSRRIVDLGAFSGIAGHAFVEYLYTGHWGLQKWIGTDDPTVRFERPELEIMLELHAIARTFQLDELETQTRDSIELAARRVEVFPLVDAVKKAYPRPIGNDQWFVGWIKTCIKRVFQDPRALSTASSAPIDFGDGFSAVKVLFNCMLETYVEALEARDGRDAAAVPASRPEPASPDTPCAPGEIHDSRPESAPAVAPELDGAVPEAAPEPEPLPEPLDDPKCNSGEPERLPGAEPIPEPTPEDTAWLLSSDLLKKTKRKKTEKKKKGTKLKDEMAPVPVAPEEMPESLPPANGETAPQPEWGNFGGEEQYDEWIVLKERIQNGVFKR